MRAALLVVALALVACGDSSTPASAPSAQNPATAACTELEGAFVPCGGDPTGVWAAKQGCLSISLGELNSDQCPERIPAELTPEGTVTFDAGVETHEVTGALTATAVLSDPCLDSLSGGLLPAARLCSEIQSQAEQQGFTGFCVHNGACYCSLHGTAPAQGSRSYELDGGRLVDPDDATREVEFCVEGTKLTLKEQDASGFFTLLVLERQTP